MHIFQRLTLNDILWVHSQIALVHRLEESQPEGCDNKLYYFAIKLKHSNISYQTRLRFTKQCFLFHYFSCLQNYWNIVYLLNSAFLFKMCLPVLAGSTPALYECVLYTQQALLPPDGEIPYEVLKGFQAVHRHDDVTKWKHFPRYWPFVRGIHRSPVNCPHKG